jgi:hypothetical protein
MSDEIKIPAMYARFFTRGELEELAAARGNSVQAEIDILRVILLRLADMPTDEIMAEGYLKYVDVVGSICTRIANLISAENKLAGGSDEIHDLNECIEEALKDLDFSNWTGSGVPPVKAAYP